MAVIENAEGNRGCQEVVDYRIRPRPHQYRKRLLIPVLVTEWPFVAFHLLLENRTEPLTLDMKQAMKRLDLIIHIANGRVSPDNLSRELNKKRRNTEEQIENSNLLQPLNTNADNTVD